MDFQHTTNIMGVGSNLISVLACTINYHRLKSWFIPDQNMLSTTTVVLYMPSATGTQRGQLTLGTTEAPRAGHPSRTDKPTRRVLRLAERPSISENFRDVELGPWRNLRGFRCGLRTLQFHTRQRCLDSRATQTVDIFIINHKSPCYFSQLLKLWESLSELRTFLVIKHFWLGDSNSMNRQYPNNLLGA